MKNIFIIGSKGIPAQYGGFETFVDRLTEKKASEEIKYHVACLSDEKGEYYYNDARCFKVKVPSIGPAKAVYYDVVALKETIDYINKKKINVAIVYILACRIGPFIGHYKKKLKKMGIKLYVNPDGHEWKRAKWNWLIRKYWKFSEKLMVKHADLLICDSVNIQKYIKKTYAQFKPRTEYIAYGADTKSSTLTATDEKVREWFHKFGLKEKEYYLVVGRFVPENNYETMLREFMKSKTKKKFVLITNVEHNKFYESLKEKTHFDKDPRIKFVGTVYDQELLTYIRQNAFAYLHGHEVGGTNPSLLEALATTQLNLLLDVGFNREVALDGAIYWNKKEGNLSNLLNIEDTLSDEKIRMMSSKAKKRIDEKYSWNYIVGLYEAIWKKV